MIRVTVWNEYLHEKEEPVRHIYPNGIHGCIKEFLQTDEDLVIKTATFEMSEHEVQQVPYPDGHDCKRALPPHLKTHSGACDSRK